MSACRLVSLFILFLIVRLLFWWIGYVYYGDAYIYYVPAGAAYLQGALPDAINPEHPPLAKYIIGFSAVYLHNPSLASLSFGLLTALVVWLFARKLIGRSSWVPVAVWLLTFDQMNIAISIDPMLEIFMLFFALLGLYLLSFEGYRYYALAGVSFGLALACKWTAFFLIVPTMICLIWRRRYLAPVGILSLAFVAYALTYTPLIVAKGPGEFLSLQAWMLNFMSKRHMIHSDIRIFDPATPVIISDWLLGPFICISTLGQWHPLGFHLFGDYYLSFNLGVNPFISLLAFPILYLQARKQLANPNRTRQILLFSFAGYLFSTMFFFSFFEDWLYAPTTALACSFAADLVANSRIKRWLIYLYLSLVAIWPLIVTAIMRF